jgi:hypothetical protein
LQHDHRKGKSALVDYDTTFIALVSGFSLFMWWADTPGRKNWAHFLFTKVRQAKSRDDLRCKHLTSRNGGFLTHVAGKGAGPFPDLLHRAASLHPALQGPSSSCDAHGQC